MSRKIFADQPAVVAGIVPQTALSCRSADLDPSVASETLIAWSLIPAVLTPQDLETRLGHLIRGYLNQRSAALANAVVRHIGNAAIFWELNKYCNLPFIQSVNFRNFTGSA